MLDKQIDWAVINERRRLVRKFVERKADIASLKLLIEDPLEENSLSIEHLSLPYLHSETPRLARKSATASTPNLADPTSLCVSSEKNKFFTSPLKNLLKSSTHHQQATTPRQYYSEQLLSPNNSPQTKTKPLTTILHIAAESNNAEAIGYLLNHGLDVGLEDGRGDTPLHSAIHCRSLEAIEQILRFLRNFSPETRKRILNFQNSRGDTVYHLKLSHPLLERLLEEGAGLININMPNFSSGSTPLVRQTIYGSRENIELLLRHGASPISRLTIKNEIQIPFQIPNDHCREFLRQEAVRYFSKACDSGPSSESYRKEVEGLVHDVGGPLLQNLQDSAHSLLSHPKIHISTYDLFSDHASTFSNTGSTILSNVAAAPFLPHFSAAKHFPLCKVVSQTITVEKHERGFLFSPACEFAFSTNLKPLDPEATFDLTIHPRSGRLTSDSPRATIRVDLVIKQEVEKLAHVFTMSLNYRESTFYFFFRFSVVPEPISPVPIIEFDVLKNVKQIADGVSLMTLNEDKVAVKFYRPDIFSADAEATGRTPITRDYVVDVNTLSKLSHPNIIQLIGRCQNPICIILEYIPLGSLGDILRNKALGEPGDAVIKFKMVWEIASAMRQVHSMGYLHRDIKPDNVLVVSLDPHEQVNVKLADFGTARYLRSKGDFTVVGSPGFCAPEISSGASHYGPEVDVFSFGFLVWFVWQAVLDIGSINPLTLPDDKRPVIDKGWDEVIATIIDNCWQPLPKLRPTFHEIEPKLLEVLSEKSVANLNL
eukprot:TRINITY_DN3470_c0_g1_i1.p1 TRINITY_DN3470_c0_g1~~TRINITY_DN3470_c0_g1_i1.p1  ORF type:complete len:767 (-),score=165.35 TRINITY_DN3470_c0_g1_i1:94-2394(-)